MGSKPRGIPENGVGQQRTDKERTTNEQRTAQERPKNGHESQRGQSQRKGHSWGDKSLERIPNWCSLRGKEILLRTHRTACRARGKIHAPEIYCPAQKTDRIGPPCGNQGFRGVSGASHYLQVLLERGAGGTCLSLVYLYYRRMIILNIRR